MNEIEPNQKIIKELLKTFGVQLIVDWPTDRRMDLHGCISYIYHEESEKLSDMTVIKFLVWSPYEVSKIWCICIWPLGLSKISKNYLWTFEYRLTLAVTFNFISILLNKVDLRYIKHYQTSVLHYSFKNDEYLYSRTKRPSNVKRQHCLQMCAQSVNLFLKVPFLFWWAYLWIVHDGYVSMKKLNKCFKINLFYKRTQFKREGKKSKLFSFSNEKDKYICTGW